MGEHDVESSLGDLMRKINMIIPVYIINHPDTAMTNGCLVHDHGRGINKSLEMMGIFLVDQKSD